MTKKRVSWSEFGKVRIVSLGGNLFLLNLIVGKWHKGFLGTGPWSIDGS